MLKQRVFPLVHTFFIKNAFINTLALPEIVD
jgi:hypothetical protein